MHRRVWMLGVVLALLGAAGCKGSGEETLRPDGADAGVRRAAQAEPAFAPAGRAQTRADGGRLLLEGVEEGARPCPPGQYACCDGTCSEHKGCPGLACDPVPQDRTFPTEQQ